MASRSRLGADLSVGSRVTVTGKKGVVKFVGPTEFAAGEWIGVELDAAEGKNNGVVNGVQYFDSRPDHGLFVKKAQVRLDRNAASPTRSVGEARTGSASASSATSPSAGRAGSRLAAIREKNKALKLSLAAGKVSPRAHRASISTFSSGPRTPTRAGSVRGESNTPGSPASIVSIGGFDGQARVSPRQASVGGRYDAQEFSPTTASLSLASGAQAVGGGRPQKESTDMPRATTGPEPLDSSRTPRVSGIPSFRARRVSRSAERRSVPDKVAQPGQAAANLPLPAPSMPPPPSRLPDQQAMDEDLEALRASSVEAARVAEEANARLAETSSKLEESEASCCVLEEKLTMLLKKSENALGEGRLKASALAKEKVAAAAAARREADMEVQVSELHDTCEALTLDKEQLAFEKEELQEKFDELQVELDSTKLDMEHAQLSARENESAARALSAAGGAGSDGSVDVKMLAEQNAELKEALKRLHAHSIAEKTDLTKSIRALEKESAAGVALKDEVEKLRSWKANKALEIEDLMEKLDESKAYEEMVEALTDKNLEIGERCGELEVTVADLESSVELSEELEMQQAEEIRELQGELTVREVNLHNQKLVLESVLKELEDTKQTIDRFREYAEQLKSSRDKLAAAATTGAGEAASTNAEKRTLLTQKASIQRLEAETRRAKASERLLQIGLLDAQARSSRFSLLFPGSLLVAETELRCTDADLSVCRLAGKANLALELLDLPAMEFVDAFAAVPGDGPGDEGGDAQAIPTIDRAAAMEDCSRLVNEAEQSAPLVQATGEALAVLTSTVLAASPALSPEAAAGVSAEVVSAVTDAEGLVDGLLRVIQDEAGLPPATVASTLSALAATSKSIGDRRIAAITSSTMRVRSEAPSSEGSGKNGGIGSAVTALQDCLIHARRAVLATTGAALREASGTHVSCSLLREREDGQSALWQSVRGLWSDLRALRNIANGGGGSWCAELEALAVGAKVLLGSICSHAADPRKSVPAALELATQVAPLRLAANELARSSLVTEDPPEGRSPTSAPVPLCPRTMWRAVAPSLVEVDPRIPGSDVGRSDLEPPCSLRAERVRALLEEAISLKPELEAVKGRTADLALELASRSKELSAATSKREQLENLLDKAEGSQALSTDLQKQMALLQAKSGKVEQENKFMAEALEDLQDSTSRLEAENRALKMSASPTGRSGASGSASSGKLAQSARTRSTPSKSRSAGGDIPPVTHVSATGDPATGCAVAGQDMEESLTTALNWSRAEVARWRGEAFTSVVSGLKPLPHLSSSQGGRTQTYSKGGTTTGPVPRVSSDASDSLRELLSLSKKLAAVRGPPRVVRVQSSTQLPASENLVSSDVTGIPTIPSSASATWHAQRVLNSRLEKEWREGQGRAASVVSSLLARSNVRGPCVYGEALAANLPTSQTPQGNLRVARIQMPSHVHVPFGQFKAQESLQVTLGRSSLARLQQALAV